MKATLNDQKTPRTKYDARYVASFPINLPADQIDLYQWVAEMTDQNYTSYSPPTWPWIVISKREYSS